MGGGDYDGDVAERTRSTSEEHFTYRGHANDAAAAANPALRKVHQDLNPKGVIRECCDSQEHPVTTPIVVVMDVSRSRGKDAKAIYNKLPMFFGQMILHGYVGHPAISFAAIGDMTDGDKAPFQMGQFEADNRLDEVLSKIWLEEGGGGSGQESYELAAYGYARKTKLDCWKRGKKGILFILGDEGFYPKVSRKQVKLLFGDNLEEDIPSAQIFAELQSKYDVFFIYPQKSWEDRKSDIDAEIEKRVREAGGMYDETDVRFSLIWHDRNDLDLHVITPSGEHIYYSHRNSRCGGELDIDRNVNGETTKPIENIRWPKGRAPKGKYKVFVQNYRTHERQKSETPFKVECCINGEVSYLEGMASASTFVGSQGSMEWINHPANVFVGEFTFDPKARPAIEGGKADLYAGYRDEVIKQQWASVLPPENILIIEDPKAIVDVMLGAIALNEGRADLDVYLGHMGERGQSDTRRSQTAKALSSLAASHAVAKVDAGQLPRGTGRKRQGGAKRL